MSDSILVRNAPFRRKAVIFSAVMAGLLGANSSGAIITSWIGPATGVWSLNTNWSGAVTPNSSAYDVFIDGGNVQNTTVDLDLNETIGSLTIGSGDALNLRNNTQLSVIGTTINNAGTITITANANNTFLLFGGAATTLTGGGTVILARTAGGVAYISDVSSTPIFNLNNTIRGQGNIGNNSSSFVNQGTVNCDVSGGVLTIDPENVAGAVTNTGTFTATNGGLLELTGANGGNFINTGGTISAQTGSQVGLDANVSISGGTFTSSGTGYIRVLIGHTANLDTFTNTGNITADNFSQLNLNGGTITNNGSINLTAAANNSVLNINGTQAIGGTGTINLSRSAGGNAIITGSGAWTNGNTIQGAGNIGNNSLQVINNKLIQATDATNGLVIDPVNTSGGVTNNGTMLANGGVLQLTGANGGDFINTSGRIISGSTDVQLVTNASITGGTLSSTGAGAIRVVDGNAASITNVTNTGAVTVGNNSQLNLGGTINNAGSISLNAVANSSVLSVGSVLLTGGGTIVLGTTGAASTVVTGSGTLTNVNNLIRGRGELGNNSISFINQLGGVVQADVAGAILNLDPANVPTSFRNQGVMRATSGGILQFNGSNSGGFDNTGATIQAQTGSEVRLVVNASITGGTISSIGTGSINVADGWDAYLDNLALSGNTRIGNNSRMVYSNALALTGSLSVNAAANPSQFYVNSSAVTISGTGSIILNQSGAGTAYLSGVGSLTLGVPVSGGGNIGNNAIGVINNSTITANAVGQSLVLDPAGLNAFTNNGTLLAAGGTMFITGSNGGTFENSAGRIISASTDVNLISNPFVNGGTFASTGAGVIRVTAGHIGQVNAIANTGNIVVDNNSDLYVTNAITNTGSISLNPVANGSRLVVNGGTVTLAGAGTIYLNTGTAGGQAQIAGSGTLINNQHIRGGGNLATNSLAVINNGTITADNALAALLLDPVNIGNSFVNNGTLLSTAGVLQLTGANGGGFDSTNGRLITGASDIQFYSGASLTGGTLSSTGVGVFRAATGQNVFFTNLTATGSVVVDNNTDLYLAGAITNNGSISFNPVANNSRLMVNSAPLNLSGTGTIFLNAGTNGSAQISGSGTLISTQFIRGAGNIGANAIAMTNNNTILADVAGVGLLLDPSNVANSFTNNGTYASSAGVLQLTGANGGAFDNTNGKIISGAGDVQYYAGASVSGGTLSSTGAGAHRAMAGQNVFFTALTSSGNVVVENNADLYLAGTITNSGSINLNAGLNNSRLMVNSASLNLTGGGTVLLSTSSAGQAQFTNSGTLNNINNLIRGQGAIGVNSMALVNTGTIQADVAATSIVLDPVNTPNAFTNNGVYRASNGGQLYFTGSNGGGFVGTGSIDVQANSFATFDTGTSFIGNAVINNGTVTAQNSSGVSVSSIAGNGTLNISTSSQVTIRANGTQSATSKVVSLTITNPAKLDLNDNALVVDYTTTSPLATIRGYILSGYNNGAWSGNGIISTASIGSASLTLGYGEATETPFTTTFRGQSFAGGDAVLVMRTIKGDANLDRAINSLDFNKFVAGYGTLTNGLWTQGDFDYNGKVNTIDFNWLAGNFGSSLPAAGDLPGGLPGPSLGSVVPEPTTLSLIPLTMLALRRKRR